MAIKGKYLKILSRIKDDSAGASVWRYMLSDIIFDLKEAFPKYNWIGIYLLDGETLKLETYLGKPPSHAKIKISDGVCGRGVREKQTIIVGNVCEDPSYLSCDRFVKSEIVVPIMKDENILGVLDIDSIKKNAFTKEDEEFLKEVSTIIGNTFPKIKKE